MYTKLLKSKILTMSRPRTADKAGRQAGDFGSHRKLKNFFSSPSSPFLVSSSTRWFGQKSRWHKYWTLVQRPDRWFGQKSRWHKYWSLVQRIVFCASTYRCYTVRYTEQQAQVVIHMKGRCLDHDNLISSRIIRRRFLLSSETTSFLCYTQGTKLIRALFGKAVV
jgi:hypothetical protein